MCVLAFAMGATTQKIAVFGTNRRQSSLASGAVRDLADALFDLSECHCCSHNSGAQLDMFTSPISVRQQCGKVACFEAKVARHANHPETKGSVSPLVTRRMQVYRESVWRKALADYFRSMAAYERIGDSAETMAVCAETTMEIEMVKHLGNLLSVGVRKAFSFDEHFLGLLAAHEIRGVCESVGLGEFVRRQRGGRLKFKSMTVGAKEGVIREVLSVKGFDYSTAVPPFMRFDEGGFHALH